MGCKFVWMMWVIMRNIDLLCFINYHLGLFWSCRQYDCGYSIYIVIIHRICWCLHVDNFFASCLMNGILVTLHQGAFLEYLVCATSPMTSLWSTRHLLEYYVNVTQTVWGISLLMHMHQDPLLVIFVNICISDVRWYISTAFESSVLGCTWLHWFKQEFLSPALARW